jgi:hypothetical protein
MLALLVPTKRFISASVVTGMPAVLSAAASTRNEMISLSTSTPSQSKMTRSTLCFLIPSHPILSRCHRRA